MGLDLRGSWPSHARLTASLSRGHRQTPAGGPVGWSAGEYIAHIAMVVCHVSLRKPRVLATGPPAAQVAYECEPRRPQDRGPRAGVGEWERIHAPYGAPACAREAIHVLRERGCRPRGTA